MKIGIGLVLIGLISLPFLIHIEGMWPLSAGVAAFGVGKLALARLKALNEQEAQKKGHDL